MPPILSKPLRTTIDDNMTQHDVSANTYYEGFSQYILQEPAKPATVRVISYKDYLKSDADCVLKYKLPELKATARANGLPVSGNKGVLTERILSHFLQTKMSTRIQKVYRKYISRTAYRLRGPAYLKRSLCVNDTDFATMDPLNEIPPELFYSYAEKGDRGMVYGFNILSLIALIQRSRKVENPYNRREFATNILLDICGLYKKVYILFPDACGEYVRDITTHIASAPPRRTTAAAASATNIETPMSRGRPIIRGRHAPMERILAIETQLEEVQSRSIEARMREVFMEIDNLGNYSDVRWFANLTAEQYCLFYYRYAVFWNRGNIDISVKLDICGYELPFRVVRLSPDIYDLDECRLACLDVVERMVYSGADIEARRLGAMHVLTHLAYVSLGARRSMPWLFS